MLLSMVFKRNSNCAALNRKKPKPTIAANKSAATAKKGLDEARFLLLITQYPLEKTTFLYLHFFNSSNFSDLFAEKPEVWRCALCDFSLSPPDLEERDALSGCLPTFLLLPTL